MKRLCCTTSTAWLLSSLLLFYVTNAAAASIGFDVKQVCKSVHNIRDDRFGAGIIGATCVVDIRLGNLKEVMKERILAGDHNAALLPVLRGSASSLLVLPPNLPWLSNGSGQPGDDSFMRDVQQQLAEPFQSLTDAMVAFTGNQGISLDLDSPLPWTGLPALSEDRNLVFHSSLNIQSLNAIPQAVVPLPPAAGLLLAGLLVLSGLRVFRSPDSKTHFSSGGH